MTESKAVDSRLARQSFDRNLKRALVRNGSPSPANIRVGSSPSRLNGEDAGGEREAAGHVLAQQPRQDLAVVLASAAAPLWGCACRTARSRSSVGADLLVAHAHDVLVAGVGLAAPSATSRAACGSADRAARVALAPAASSSGGRVVRSRLAPAAAAPRAGCWQSRAACTCSATRRRGSRAPSRRSRRGSAAAPPARCPPPAPSALPATAGARRSPARRGRARRAGGRARDRRR